MRMRNHRAARRPTLVLNRKIHDEIGFALRKYVKATGWQAGPVQLKTRRLLTSLHEDLLCDGHEPGEWRACSVEPCSGLGEVKMLSQVPPSPPPGLELLSVPEERDQNCVYSGSDLDTPRCSQGVPTHTPWGTPVKTSEPKAVPPAEGALKDTGSEDAVAVAFRAKPNEDQAQKARKEEAVAFAAEVVPSPHEEAKDAVPEKTAVPTEETPSEAEEKPKEEAIAPADDTDEIEEKPKEEPAPEALKEEAVVHLKLDSSTSALDASCRLGIALQGMGFSKQRQFNMIQQLVDAASQTLMARGFSSVRQGIKVEKLTRSERVDSIELSFPCATSARGFYLLFNQYHWDTSGGSHCVVVELTNIEFERQWKALDPKVRHRFSSSSEVTPSSVDEYFH